MSLHAILGSGFGLYGYLPAVASKEGAGVVLPESARPRFAARPELQRFAPRIDWARDADEALGRASVAILAVPPAAQPALVEACLRHPALGAIVLEKPVAPSPASARLTLDAIARVGRRCRVGFTIAETAWASRLLASPPAGPLEIDWAFRAHHYAAGLDTWKRRHAEGGGALRFYGIHLVALLARLGYRDSTASRLEESAPGEPQRWTATLAGPGLDPCTVRVDTRSDHARFAVQVDGRAFAELPDAFDFPPGADGLDRRVPAVARILESLADPDALHRDRIEHAQALWTAIEKATEVTGAARG